MSYYEASTLVTITQVKKQNGATQLETPPHALLKFPSSPSLQSATHQAFIVIPSRQCTLILPVFICS